MRYSLSDIDSIREKDPTIKLDQKIIEVIANILKEVGSPEYNIAPQFKYDNQKHWLKHNPRKVKHKNEFETLIDNIRFTLNKITDKTYSNQFKLLQDNLQKFKEIDDNDKCGMINDLIYHVLTKNRFYSELYSLIYKNLINDYPFIYNHFCIKKLELVDVLSTINNSTNENSYDEFCDINKDNEIRRALILFYVNLMKHKVVSMDLILEIRNKISSLILQEIAVDDKCTLIEELSNLLFIIITNLEAKVTLDDTEFMEYMDTIMKSNTKDYSSLTNKIKFRHMDIKDYLTKNE